MTRFWDGRTDGKTDGRTDGRSDCTPRPAFAFGDAGKKGDKPTTKFLPELLFANNGIDEALAAPFLRLLTLLKCIFCFIYRNLISR